MLTPLIHTGREEADDDNDDNGAGTSHPSKGEDALKRKKRGRQAR